MDKSLQVFSFEENEVRVVMKNGEPWWVAKDVCDILELSNPTEAVRNLDEDETISLRISEGIRGNPNMTVISESGLYSLIFRSNKPEARKFRKWVTSEILPALRKHGNYNFLNNNRGSPRVTVELRELIELVSGKVSMEVMDEISIMLANQIITSAPHNFRNRLSVPNPQDEEDIKNLEKFIEDTRPFDDKIVILKASVKDAFISWCNEMNIVPPKEKRISSLLSKMGFSEGPRVGQRRTWAIFPEEG